MRRDIHLPDAFATLGGLARDAATGANLALAMLPKGMAYAAVAGVPPGMTETCSLSRFVAHRKGQRSDPEREAVGQGLANLAVAFVGGYPVSTSLSGTSVNLAGGARGPGPIYVFTAVALLVALSLGSLFAVLPSSRSPRPSSWQLAASSTRTACGAAGLPVAFAEATSGVLERLDSAGVSVSGLAFPTVDEACAHAIAEADAPALGQVRGPSSSA